MDEQDSRPNPQVAKKKKKKGKIIAVGAGLEDFVDWVDPNASDPAKERENDMSNFAAKFFARMGGECSSSEVSSEKRPKQFGPYEEA